MEDYQRVFTICAFRCRAIFQCRLLHWELNVEYRKKPIHLGMTNSVVKRRAKKAEFPLMQIDLKACREMWRGKVIPQLQCQHWQSCCWAEAGCGGAGWQRSLLLISHLGRRYLATTHSKNTFTFLLSFIPA